MDLTAYTVTNNACATAGGARFTGDIGVDHSKQILASATAFIWSIFQQTDPADRKNVHSVDLFIDVMDGVAYADNNEIHVSSNYIGNYTGDLEREFSGVLYREMTHIWQWDGQGDRWDRGYDVTARFLDYCNDLRNGFVAELDNKMRTGYSAQYFVDLLGKTVDELWTNYKAKYGT
ncbi:hypothetical protein POTOM_005879 [Populus tomentosa]|uniref:Plant basic secretory protein (BSP) family protein n=1 Tax=Populus tomentosa TaxID=118781 RepID=A0A8X8DEG2_POPTO|nr:hypothetical protein POTOM_005879 [Populus tomentosa]